MLNKLCKKSESIHPLTESSEGSGSDGKGDDPGKKDKGYKPMPKWQKISYWVTGVLMGAVFIGNGVLFCKFFSNFEEIFFYHFKDSSTIKFTTD